MATLRDRLYAAAIETRDSALCDLLADADDRILELEARQCVPRGSGMKAYKLWLATREQGCNGYGEAYRAGYWDAVKEMGAEIVDDAVTS